MKKLIAKLLVGIFSLGLCLNLSAEEWKSYKFKGGGVTIGEDLITLEEGDKAEVSVIMADPGGGRKFVARIWVDDENYAEDELTVTSGSSGSKFFLNFRTYIGPCKLQFGSKYLSPENWLVCNVKITRAHEQKGSNVSGYSLVLPEGEGGKQKLVLESSTDLVNWTEDSLGSKDSSDKKRFYRLRAVKE